jgi:saccharopine dehydrogenase-like NADP-dependent oxidoreductase
LFVPALGVLEAAVTTGGVSFSPDHLNLRRFSYKTLRYPGHWDFVEKHILNQPEPARVLEALIGNAGPDNPDIVVLAFRLTNDVGNCAMPSYFWEYEPDLGLHGLSAMAQSTGFIVGSVARMLHEGTAPRWGVLGMHEIDPVDIIANITEVFPDQFCELPLDFSEDDDG